MAFWPVGAHAQPLRSVSRQVGAAVALEDRRQIGAAPKTQPTRWRWRRVLAGKDGEIILNGEGWRHQPRSYLAPGVAERAWHQVKVVGQNVVWVKDVDPVWRDRVLWKVSQVEGDDHVTASAIAAARTWRSSGSGSSSAGSNGSYPVTRHSRVARSIRSRVRSRVARSRPCSLRSRALIHSRRMSAVHFARKRLSTANCRKISRIGAG